MHVGAILWGGLGVRVVVHCVKLWLEIGCRLARRL